MHDITFLEWLLVLAVFSPFIALVMWGTREILRERRIRLELAEQGIEPVYRYRGSLFYYNEHGAVRVKSENTPRNNSADDGGFLPYRQWVPGTNPETGDTSWYMPRKHRPARWWRRAGSKRRTVASSFPVLSFAVGREWLTDQELRKLTMTERSAFSKLSTVSALLVGGETAAAIQGCNDVLGTLRREFGPRQHWLEATILADLAFIAKREGDDKRSRELMVEVDQIARHLGKHCIWLPSYTRRRAASLGFSDLGTEVV